MSCNAMKTAAALCGTAGTAGKARLPACCLGLAYPEGETGLESEGRATQLQFKLQA